MKNIIIFSILALFLAACQQQSPPAKPQTDFFSQTPSADNGWPMYLVGIDTSHQPYVTRDEYGRPDGFDIALLRAIAQQEHFQVTFVPVVWNNILNRLENRSIDIIASGMMVTPERQARAALTIPYNYFHFSLMTRSNSPYQSVDNLNGARIAVVNAPPVIHFLHQFLKGVNFQTVPYPTTFLAIKSVMNGENTAVFAHHFVLQHYLNTLPKSYYSGSLRSIPLPDGAKSLPVVMGVRKDDVALLNKLNDGIRKVRENGEFQKISQRWLGDTEDAQAAQ